MNINEETDETDINEVIDLLNRKCFVDMVLNLQLAAHSCAV